MTEDNIELLLHEVSELRKVFSKSEKETQKMLLKELEEIKEAAGITHKQYILQDRLNRQSKETLQQINELKIKIGTIDTSEAEKCLKEFKDIRIPSPDLRQAEKLMLKLRLLFLERPIPSWQVKVMIGMFLLITVLILANFRHKRKIVLLSKHRSDFIQFVNSKKSVKSEFYNWYGYVDTVGGYRPVMILPNYIEKKYKWYKPKLRNRFF